MPLEFAAQNLCNHIIGVIPGFKFHVLKRNIDNRVLALISAIFLSASPDLFVPEINRRILIRLLKEHAQHVHVQRFAKPAWASKQRYLRSLIDEVTDQQRLVHVIILARRFTIIRNPDRQRQLLSCSSFYDSNRPLILPALIHRLFSIIRDKPAPPFFIGTGNASFLAKNTDSAFRDIPSLCRFFHCHNPRHKRTSEQTL